MEKSVMLKALGEKTRLSIFQQLLIRKHCVRSLSRKLGMTESAISQHMKVLKEAGLVYPISRLSVSVILEAPLFREYGLRIPLM